MHLGNVQCEKKNESLYGEGYRMGGQEHVIEVTELIGKDSFFGKKQK